MITRVVALLPLNLVPLQETLGIMGALLLPPLGIETTTIKEELGSKGEEGTIPLAWIRFSFFHQKGEANLCG